MVPVLPPHQGCDSPSSGIKVYVVIPSLWVNMLSIFLTLLSPCEKGITGAQEVAEHRGSTIVGCLETQVLADQASQNNLTVG